MPTSDEPDFDPTELLLDIRFPGHRPDVDVAFDFDLTVGEQEVGLALAREVEAQRKAWHREDWGSLMPLLDFHVNEAFYQSRAAWEATLFFNHWSTDADFSFWSKASYWTLEEGLALAFGKNPKAVSWSTIRRYPKAAFVGRYALLRELAVRDKDAYHLEERVSPGVFIAWAKQQDVKVPEDLVAAVEARGIPIANLRTHYNWAVAENSRMMVEFGELRRESGILRTELDAANARVAKLEEGGEAWQFDPDSDTYPWELDIALITWRTHANRPQPPARPRSAIEAFLRKNYPKLKPAEFHRIATICNWQRAGGRKPKLENG